MAPPRRGDRRNFLELTAGCSVAAVSLLPGCSALGVPVRPASGGEGTTTFRLGARSNAWRGIAPAAIRGERNPIIEMEPGRTVDVVWENLDGTTHGFVVENSLGETLVESPRSSEQGESRTVTFEANQAMTTYLDPLSPVFMRGELLVTTY